MESSGRAIEVLVAGDPVQFSPRVAPPPHCHIVANAAKLFEPGDAPRVSSPIGQGLSELSFYPNDGCHREELPFRPMLGRISQKGMAREDA
jgi:hypothetical protein